MSKSRPCSSAQRAQNGDGVNALCPLHPRRRRAPAAAERTPGGARPSAAAYGNPARVTGTQNREAGHQGRQIAMHKSRPCNPRLKVTLCKSSHAAQPSTHKAVTGPAHLGLCTHVGATLQQQPSALQVAFLRGKVQRRLVILREFPATPHGRRVRHTVLCDEQCQNTPRLCSSRCGHRPELVAPQPRRHS